MSETDWTVFLDSWCRYKEMCGLTQDVADRAKIRNELRAACAPAINKMMMQLNGAATLQATTETELLALVKDVAVMSVDKQVHRQTFCRITQGEGESISQYVARIKAQADLCEFQIKCGAQHCDHNTSYKDDMVSSQTINGMANAEYQTKILNEITTLGDFKDLYAKLIGMEAMEKSSHQIQNAKTNAPMIAAAVKTQYRRMQNQRPGQSTHQNQQPTQSTHQPHKRQPFNTQQSRGGSQNRGGSQARPWPCRGCGKTSHPSGSMTRESCPAHKVTCHNCKIEGHFASVCFKARSKAASATDDPTGAQAAGDQDEVSYQQSVAFAFSAETQDFREAKTNPPHR